MLNTLFDLDNKVFRILGKVGDIICLNIIFLISCIPIVTIGAAITALYDVAMKLSVNHESYIIKGYFKSVRENFKKSTSIWIAILGAYIVILLDIKVANMYDSMGWSIVHYLLVILFILLNMLASYIFPMQAKFENTYLNTIKMAFIMSIKHLPTTIMILIFNAILPFCLIASNESFWNGLIGFGFFGFALVAYLNSMILLRVFEKYL